MTTHSEGRVEPEQAQAAAPEDPGARLLNGRPAESDGDHWRAPRRFLIHDEHAAFAPGAALRSTVVRNTTAIIAAIFLGFFVLAIVVYALLPDDAGAPAEAETLAAWSPWVAGAQIQ